jgi:hypothetical protein
VLRDSLQRVVYRPTHDFADRAILDAGKLAQSQHHRIRKENLDLLHGYMYYMDGFPRKMNSVEVWLPSFWIVVISGFAGCGLLGFLICLWRLRRPAKVYVDAVASILTPAEQLFAQSLEAAVDGRWRTSFKVRVADIIEVRSTDSQERQRLFRRIAAKHIDFLLTDSESFEPIAAVELDDSSHNRVDRRQRDQFLDELFAVAELPLVRIDAAACYAPKKIYRALEAALTQRQ